MFKKGLRNIGFIRTSISDKDIGRDDNISELSLFDECIEACDALASNNPELTDCSVLVSPDGRLLLNPNNSSKLELYGMDEYEGSVRIGNDLNGGDYDNNGFSAKGILPSDASAILDDTKNCLTSISSFVEEYLLIQKEVRVNTIRALNIMIDGKSSGGPLFEVGSSIHDGVSALEEYLTTSNERELSRHRCESQSMKEGILPKVQLALRETNDRCDAREKALERVSKNVIKAKKELKMFKAEALKCDVAVKRAEELAKSHLLEVKKERRREHEMRLLEEKSNAQNNLEHEDIWQKINSISNQMDFEPATLNDLKASSRDEEEPSFPSLAEIESEYNLQQLRNSKIAADNSVEDSATALLNALSLLDTCYRSSELAAEGCLLSAGHSQKRCLRGLVKMERDFLSERLEKIEKVEKIIDNINVQQDLDLRLKKANSTTTQGIASAMAVMNSYCIESNPIHTQIDPVIQGWGEEEVLCYDEIKDYVEVFFQKIDEPKLDIAVSQLQNAVIQEPFVISKKCRAGICHALNIKRSVQTQIDTLLQFNALCTVFHSLLTGCDCNDYDDVSNAKMCIMLAQTFFITSNDSNKDKIFVRKKLGSHPIWSNESFWPNLFSYSITTKLRDQALFQCVSQSIAHNKPKSQPVIQLWHDLSSQQRVEVATQLHALIFSQLGALAHSMLEFQCQVNQVCSFIRRMSVRHQLPLTQRLLLMNIITNHRDQT